MRFNNWDALPLLLLFFVAVWLVRRKLRRPSRHSLVHRFQKWTLQRTSWVRLPEYLTAAALILIGLSLLDPVLALAQVGVTTRGMNIVMLVDLSSSMLELMQKEAGGHELQGARTKLEAAKDAIRKFVERRRGDRVGALVFSERAYVVVPLTLDYHYVGAYLNFIDYRTLAGEGRTAIGEAIFAGMSLIRWKEPDRTSPAVVVIFTDGESNAGRSVYEALETAHKENVHVYLIGLDMWYVADRERLTKAYRTTGGDFYDVKDLEQLALAYETIDAEERQPLVTQQYVRNHPYYYPFAGAALLCLVLAGLLRALPYFVEIS